MNNNGSIMDVRAIPPRERHPRIFTTFDDLPPDGAFELVNDHNPVPLLHQFHFERRDGFEWWPLEQGPAIWRVLIAKRGRTAPASITDLLQRDHRRLDVLWAAFRDHVEKSQLNEGRARFSEFALGLRRHIRIEEEILFPIFEERTGMHAAGPTAVMRQEHRGIQSCMAEIESALSSNDAPIAASKIAGPADELVEILTGHNRKEEQILYPMSDQSLSQGERDDLVHRMRAY
ncbi:MAG: DUF2249 domain-containing protein [Nitrospirae bacterium]|nr:DUF2249 domain-containing protein [Nitrospirota bacterium]